jgi:hypothetical protein
MRGLVKLPALKGGASREGHFLLYCAPSCLPVGRDTALKDGALRGTCAGQLSLRSSLTTDQATDPDQSL